MKTRPSLLVVALVLGSLVVAGTAQAKFRVTVTKSDGFKPGDVQKVAVVTTECHETVDCSNLERRVIVELQNQNVDFQLIPESRLRSFLFEEGATAYAPEHREAIAKKFEVDAFLELQVPFAVKGDGFGGRESSQVKLELRLTKVDGGILLHGVGVGRPNNVVSSPERAAGNVVEKFVKKAFP